MKTLCGLDRKEIEKNLRGIIKEVARPRYICVRCARTSISKKHLCKPVRIPKKRG